MLFFYVVCLGFTLNFADAWVYPACCPNVTTQENFDYTKYTGSWYDWEHSTDITYTCALHGYTIESENVLNLHSKIQEPNGTVKDERGSFIVRNSSHPLGKDLVTAKQWLDLPAFYVLATDYDTYSVEFACTCTSEGQKTESVYLLLRSNSITEETRREILEILSGKGVVAELVDNFSSCHFDLIAEDPENVV